LRDGHEVGFATDATQLRDHFSKEAFDTIQFNFPHWKGKANNKHNRWVGYSKMEDTVPYIDCVSKAFIPIDIIYFLWMSHADILFLSYLMSFHFFFAKHDGHNKEHYCLISLPRLHKCWHKVVKFMWHCLTTKALPTQRTFPSGNLAGYHRNLLPNTTCC
jgi:hypothetical protein